MTVTTQSDRAVAFWQLIRTEELPDLGQRSRPGVLARVPLTDGLERLATLQGWEPYQAERLVAAALLYHDHHNEAHDIVQDHVDVDGALVHAILHRREPDFWNARYWFRRVGDHPAYRLLTSWLEASRGGLPGDPPEEWNRIARRLTLGGWVDPLAMVDLCEEVHGSGAGTPAVDILRRVQQAEFEALVAHLLA